MANHKIGILKPFNIEDRKDSKSKVSEITANKWQGCLLQNIRKEPRWVPLLDLVWQQKKVQDRGVLARPAQPGPPAVEAVPPASIAADIDALLEYVSQYSPNCLYRDITNRATSLNNEWILVRKWAGLKSSGCRHQAYWQVKRSWDPNADVPPTDFTSCQGTPRKTASSSPKPQEVGSASMESSQPLMKTSHLH